MTDGLPIYYPRSSQGNHRGIAPTKYRKKREYSIRPYGMFGLRVPSPSEHLFWLSPSKIVGLRLRLRVKNVRLFEP